MFNIKKLGLGATAAVCRRIAGRSAAQQVLFNAVRLNKPEIHDLLVSDDIRFLSYCVARRDRSRLQVMQDLWVLLELGERMNGYFVEFGATNGLKNSNTWLLEKELGWKGILAEPNPIWQLDLSINRSAPVEHKCVSSRSGDLVDFIATNNTDPELSAIAQFANLDHFAETRSGGEFTKVETISLDDLLDKFEAPLLIDYMSIDTEGSELEILASYSFRHSFRTISVENNPATEKPIHDLLLSKGYKRVFKQFSQWDSWYVAAGMRDGSNLTISAPDS